MTQQTVLVTGATGNQGGAVARALLDHQMKVRAFVRDPAKPKAQALAELGAELVRGDLGDAGSLVAAARGVDSVFVLTTPFAPGVGIDGDVVEINEKAVDDPTLINTDPYDEGWLIKIKASDVAQLDRLLDSADYDARA